jgi:hypothetical protein
MRSSRWLSNVETSVESMFGMKKGRLPVVSTGLNHQGKVFAFATALCPLPHAPISKSLLSIPQTTPYIDESHTSAT